MNNPLVSVCMITYNHEDFISQAIESIIMQKTDFPIELIIGEDCSTDQTRKICFEYQQKYPNIIKLHKRKKNLGMSVNFATTLESCRGKYTAFCEGDDYWTDPLKLQRQVDFLEANPTYAICWTKYKILESERLSLPDWLSIIEGKPQYDIDLNNIFTPYSTYTLTVMFRRDAFSTEHLSKMKHSKDNTLYCMCLSKGKGAILNFFGGVYRIHSGGVFSSSSEFEKAYSSYLNIKEITTEINNCNNQNLNKIKNKLLDLSLYTACNQAITVKAFQQVMKAYIRMLREFPLQNNIGSTKTVLKQLLNLFKSCLVAKLVRKL